MAGTAGTTADELLESAAPVLARCAAVWNEPDLAARLTLVVGPRMTRSLGRCHPERGLVRIARFVVELGGELRDEVICHEAAHHVVFARHGRGRRPHGAEWKALMRAVGLVPRARVALSPAVAAFAAAPPWVDRLWEHRCPVCRAARVARRRMGTWRCRRCMEAGRPGTLEILACERSALRG